MLQQLRDYLTTLSWNKADPPPVIDLALYFEGNDDETCLAPNQWGEGRPPIAAMYKRFQEIAQRSSVERVLVGLHESWRDDLLSDSFPPAENVHIYSNASPKEVECWLNGLHADGVTSGWPYGMPANAPKPTQGFKVYTVCWD